LLGRVRILQLLWLVVHAGLLLLIVLIGDALHWGAGSMEIGVVCHVRGVGAAISLMGVHGGRGGGDGQGPAQGLCPAA
jgi:hypothetical protein